MPLTVRIINPDRELFKGEVNHMLVPGVRGTLGLMPGHTPLFAELKKGDIQIQRAAGGATETVPVESGILRIRDDKVVILVSPKPEDPPQK